jgi:hypothetical protein
MFFTGCTSDTEDEQQAGRVLVPVEVKDYVMMFNENVALTRSWAPPTGYEAYPDVDKSIGVWLTQDASTPVIKKGYFFKSSGKWRAADLELETAGSYYLYGYIPHTPTIKASIAPGAGGTYASGATLTLQDVPAVTANDLCVTIGAKEGPNADTDNGLRLGDFQYQAQAITSANGGTGNFVFLLFDHLYAALRIRMKVHGNYNDLRTIKLKKLELQTQINDTPSKDKTDVEIVLAATDGSTNPIQSVTFTPSSGAKDITEGMEFWSSTAGETLKTVYNEYISYFMPLGINTLILTSTYDVYDKQGNLVRQNCKATNTMKLSDLFSEQETTRRGARYTVNMTIHPTYLYMLSEPDLDNPTVIIGN